MLLSSGRGEQSLTRNLAPRLTNLPSQVPVCTWVEKHCSVRCLAQRHNEPKHHQVIESGSWPGSLSQVPHSTAWKIRHYGWYESYVLCSTLHPIKNILYFENPVVMQVIVVGWPLRIYIFNQVLYHRDECIRWKIYDASSGIAMMYCMEGRWYISWMSYCVFLWCLMCRALTHCVREHWSIVYRNKDPQCGRVMIHHAEGQWCVVWMRKDAMSGGPKIHFVEEQWCSVCRSIDALCGRVMMHGVEEQACLCHGSMLYCVEWKGINIYIV